jgi:hypothetical protein
MGVYKNFIKMKEFNKERGFGIQPLGNATK